MFEQYDFLSQFSVCPIGTLWPSKLPTILEANPQIKKRCLTSMEKWFEKTREQRPTSEIDKITLLEFGSGPSPFELEFYQNTWDYFFEPEVPVGPEQIAFWNFTDTRFLFSELWLDLCKAWHPDGDWIRLDTSSHSIVIEMKKRMIFDPRFYADRDVKYILDMMVIGSPIKNSDYDQTRNFIAWFDFHLNKHSRPNLPSVLTEALQYDLPEYLLIIQALSDVVLPALQTWHYPLIGGCSDDRSVI